MATITETEQTIQESPVTNSDQEPKSTSRPRRRWGKWLVASIIVVAGGGLLAAISPGLASFGEGEEGISSLKHRVTRDDMVISITVDGNVESAANIDVKCQVYGGSTILWIVEDGTQVKKGDLIVQLDAATIEDQVAAQQILYERAQSTLFQAEQAVSTAKIAVEEYINGIYIQEKKTLEANVTVARQNLKNAQDSLEHAEKMFRKGFVTALERDSKEQGVQRAQLDLDTALTALNVLEKYTKKKMLEDFQSQVATAESTLRAENAAFESEKVKLDRLKQQLQNCEIRAPQDGMVVYANDLGGRRSMQQEADVAEGATVRQGQSIIRLPDLSQMQVKVVVHESNVDRLNQGMPARIRIQDRAFDGEVVSVSTQPEPGSWFSSNVKEYGTLVRIKGQPQGLKPGMTAEVEIVLDELDNVVAVPVAAVIERRGKFYCWTDQGGRPQRRELLLGQTNTTHIAVNDGLQEGDVVYLNPRLLEATLQPADQKAGKTGDAESDESGDGKQPGSETAVPGPGNFSERSRGPEDAGQGGQRDFRGPPGGSGPPGESGPQDRPQRQGRFTASSMLDRLDADKDGKISKSEAPDRMQTGFDNLDSNQDGFLDSAEIGAMMQSFGARRGGGPDGEPGADRRSGGQRGSGAGNGPSDRQGP